MQSRLRIEGGRQVVSRCRPVKRRAVRCRSIARPVRCMVTKETIKTDKAPTPVGAYSLGVKAHKFLFVSGQLGIVPGTSKLVTDDAKEQAKQAMENMKAILEAGGSSFEAVVKTTVLLADINDYKAVNKVYAEYFKGEFPARALYAVRSLPLNALVEIEAIAVTD